MVSATIRVPHEDLAAGPRGHRFHVVDHDASTGRRDPPTRIPGVRGGFRVPAQLGGRRAREFRAQNVYAIAARLLGIFEASLGRRVPWAFAGHQLYLVPEAFEEANAFYAERDQALYFGYVREGGRAIHTSLSHDIVAHEVTHAILDGLRDRFDTPGLPDQAAFHEAFADITALLSTFSLPELLEVLLRRAVARGDLRLANPSGASLGRVVGNLAEELGGHYHEDARGQGLRNSYALYERADPKWRGDERFDRPHRRGEILVACVIGGLVDVWLRRLAVIDTRRLDVTRIAHEGARSAEHVLKMCVRALDYCPPLEFEFEDFLNAVVTSDREMEPDDTYGYRSALLQSFARLGIRRPKGRIVDLAADGVPLTYDNLNYARLREDPDEVYRFLWQNSALLEIDPRWYTRVENVRRVMRVAADGFVVEDAMVDYVQELQGRPREVAGSLGVRLPTLPADRDVKVVGGGVLIFDQFGRAKFHVRKPIGEARRQRDRARYLVRTGRNDSLGRYGFSERIPEGQRFALAHRPPSEETW